MSLTQRERDLLTIVAEHIEDFGISPTYREIASQLGTRSMSSVHRVVHRLQDKGVISVSHLPRSIRVRDNEVPVVKRWLEERVSSLRRAPPHCGVSHERADILADELETLA
jgi:SOS-response transcriptional repressor LexA